MYDLMNKPGTSKANIETGKNYIAKSKIVDKSTLNNIATHKNFEIRKMAEERATKRFQNLKGNDLILQKCEDKFCRLYSTPYGNINI